MIMGQLENDFLEKGYSIISIENKGVLNEFQSQIINAASKFKSHKTRIELDQIHQSISIPELNDFRVNTFNEINDRPNVTTEYYSMFEEPLSKLIGSELACQNKINLSIQMPNDATSILALHTDTIAGQSKFEVVCWLPLTSAFDSNAMYVFSLDDSQEMAMQMPKYQEKGMDSLLKDWKHKATFIEIEPGQAVIFSSNLMHGNLLNETDRTRISLNTRYKALFSPYNDQAYSEKKLGSFYKPLNISPVTKIALNIDEPQGMF